MSPLESVLLIEVPETESLVGSWRERFDSSAADGVPAHITLLYPMGPPEEMTEEVRRDIGALFEGVRPFRFRLERPGRFPDVLFLAPEPDAPFRELIRLIVDRFRGPEQGRRAARPDRSRAPPRSADRGSRRLGDVDVRRRERPVDCARAVPAGFRNPVVE
jgi:2'-5' RNA ligase